MASPLSSTPGWRCLVLPTGSLPVQSPARKPQAATLPALEKRAPKGKQRETPGQGKPNMTGQQQATSVGQLTSQAHSRVGKNLQHLCIGGGGDRWALGWTVLNVHSSQRGWSARRVGQRHPQSQKAEGEALSSRQAWEGPQGNQGSVNKRVAGCAEAALHSAEGSRVMALGSSDTLDHHSRRSGEARVRATLHVVGSWAGTAGCGEKVEPTRLERQGPRSSQLPAGCPQPCPGQASSLGGLLTGTEPGGEGR